MEKDLEVGKVAKVSLSFSGGKATLIAKASGDNDALGVDVSISVDAGVLVDQLEAIVAKAVPASALIDPIIFGEIKKVVLSIA